jgi:predicted O-methyltransferase YrrM
MGEQRVLKLERAKQIHGWMTDVELEWLAIQAQVHYRIAEVGSWHGRSPVALAENTPGVVFAIDTWKGSEEHTADMVGPEGELFKRFASNIKGLPAFPIMSTSVEAARHFRDCDVKFFDMIFIDASHDYDNVKADILAWRSLLQPRGILCGHDFDGTWPGLERAVTEVLGEVKVVAGSIWLKEG